MNVVHRIDDWAKRHPERPAILFEGDTVTYGRLCARIESIAIRLQQEARVGRGDRVGIYLPNVPDFCASYLATLKLGAVAVSVGAMLKQPEVLQVLRDSGARALLSNRELCSDGQELASRLSGLRVLYLEDGSGSNACEQRGTSDASHADPVAALGPNTPAAILYTSGTTGKQKGAVLTHGNLVSNSDATARYVGSGPGDRHMLFLPLSHCFGQNFIMNTTLRTGGTIVLMRRFEPNAVLRQAALAEATHFYAVPSVYIQLLEHASAERLLKSVRYFFSAAATMPVEVAVRFEERFGRRIHEGYGLTETSPLASYNHETRYRLGSIGVPIEGVDMKVVGEDGSDCSPGQWGEICIRGPNVMAGYFRNDEETALAMRGSWFRSGDIGYCDSDGYYFLVDRQKDMINRSGFKIWPREVEEVLYRHAAVKECAVVGTAHPTHGESVVAYIMRAEGSAVSVQALREHCRAQLAGYKVPERFVLEAPIPKNASGKILKQELRRRASEDAP